MRGEEFAGRWYSIDLVIDEGAKISDKETVEGVMVDYGQLMLSGLGPLGHFRMWESLDGLADFVFKGRDAEALAKEMKANNLGDGHYGWKDLPDESISSKAQPVQQRIDAENLAINVDYRPHCNLEKLNAQIRDGEGRTAQIVLDGNNVVGFDNRWGDGIFALSRCLDRNNEVVRIRIELGTEKRQQLVREINLRIMGAIVTRAILEDGESIRFAERMEPNNPNDSGWFFSAGVEDEAYMEDPNNFVVVKLQTIIDRFPAASNIITYPEGSMFKLNGDSFVVDDE